MNARGIFSFLIICIWILVLASSNTVAQKASAEFISSLQPMKLETGEQVRDGIQNLYYKDQRLYVTNVWAGLQVIDVTNMNEPVELGTFRSEARTHNVYVQDNYAYLSKELGGVAVLDISNPQRIVQVSTIETQSDAFWVVADFPYVFVAEQQNGVNVYSISDLANPTFVTNFETPQWAWNLFLEDNLLYVADKAAGMIILDVSNPNSLQRVGQYSNMKYTKRIYVENGLAYIANGPDGLSILDVSNPKFPKLVSKLTVDGFVNDAQRSGNSLFIANELRRRLEIIDVTRINAPVKVAEYVAEGKVYSASKTDVYVFVAADNQTVILRHNNPPVLAEIEDQVVDETQTLHFTAQGSDPDDDPIFYQIENLPEGAVFDSLNGAFTWTPTYEQSGVYPGIQIDVLERTAAQLSATQTFDITVNHVNRNPVLSDVPDSTVLENQTITFTIPEGSDPDVEDKGKLVYLAENMPEGAQFNPDLRVFSWKPTFEQSGVYMVDFVVQDPPGAVMRDGASITVIHVDRKPEIAPIAGQTVNENEELTFTIEGSDPDREDQNLLSYEAQNLPDGAQFDPTTASFTWTPTYDQSGEYPDPLFIFTAGKLSDSVTVGITVNHVNRAPALAAISNQTIDENKTLQFSISGSDADVEDNGKLVYSAENVPAGAVFNPDSLLFTWTPDFEQSGSYENIAFTVSDPDGLTDTKELTIDVAHVNRSPQLAALEPQTVDENTLLTFDLQGTDPDREDEGKLVFSASGLPEGAVLEGTTFSWTPTYDQSGTYTISFTVSDGRLEDVREAVVTVNHVNRDPAIADIAPQSVNENDAIRFNVVGSDPDTEDDGTWILSAESLPEGAVFTPETGLFNWTPGFDQSGSHTVTFINTDPQGLTASKDVTIEVNHVNRTPVLPDQPSQVVDENAPLSFTVIAAEDPDVEDEGQLIYSARNLPEGAVFDPQTRVLEWTPTYEQSGSYTCEIDVKDGEFTVTQTIDITVNHVNRPPSLETVEGQTVNENEPWSLTVSYSDPDQEDAGKVVLTAENLPEGATFNPQTGVLSWTPTYEQSGNYPGISVVAADEAGLTDRISFDIQVNHVNRAPSLEAVDPVTGSENTPISITLQGTDPDQEDSGKLVYSADNLPEGAVLDAQSGLFTWTPGYLQAGTYSIGFKVTDTGGLSAEQTAEFSIADVNRTPVVNAVAAQTVAENSTLTFQVTASDEDTDNTLTYTAANLPEGASFDAASRTFTWTPGYEQAGSYTVTFMVSDGKEEVTTDVLVTVQNVNRAPVFDETGPKQVDEKSELSFTITATDPDAGTTLSYTAGALPEGASFDAATGQFSWTPGYEQAGSYSVPFTVSDEEDETTMSVEVTVNNVNRVPVFEPVDSQMADENQILTFNVTASDEDDGSALDYSARDLPDGASFQGQTFTWTPGFDQAGSYTVTFVVSDGMDEVELQVPVTVNNVNRGPEISAPSSSDVRAGEEISLSFSASDPDNDKLEFSSPDLPSGAQLDPQSGVLRWTPSDDQVGKATVTVRVSDGNDQAEAKTEINIRMPQPVNTEAPPDTTGGID